MSNHPIKFGSAGLLLVAGSLSCVPFTLAQDAISTIEQVVVTATRREQPINEVSRTVVVLDKAVIAEELSKTSNIGTVLGNRVPGYGAPNHIDQLRTQTLRGREPLYLIDGIPLAFNGGAGFLQGPLTKFDSGMIDRVEVLYGPTALYGAGAAGGVIQFFTYNAPRDTPLELNFRQQFVSYPEADDPFDGDALSWKSAIRAAGTVGMFDYVASYSYDSQNGVYDGNGDIANPVYYGYADDSSYFVKLGFEPDENQRFTAMYSYVDREFEDTNFDFEITDDDFAIAVPAEDDTRFRYLGNNEPYDEKTFYSFSYAHADLWGTSLQLQLYHREDDIREPLADLGFSFPPFPDNYQNVKVDESDGVRFQLSRGFGDQITILVGADYEEQKREAVALVYDIGTLNERSRDVTEPVRDGLFIYPFTLDTLGLFAQVEYVATDDLRFSAGLRHEDAEFEIGSGLRLFDPQQVDRPGGSGSDNGYAYNLGVTYDLIPQLTVYASYAEGYELPSLSQVSSLVPPDQPLESDEAIEPQIVDNYEIGLRGIAGAFTYALATYYSESDFGQNFLYDTATGLGRYNRSPEKTYGFEIESTWQATDNLLLSAAFGWNEGDFDELDDGNFASQSGLDIQPWKATLHGYYQVTDRLSFNFLVLAVGDRDEAFEDEVDLWEVEGYEIMDIGLDYQLGINSFSVQITNLFNKTYLAPSSQSYTNSLPFRPRVAGAPGRAVALNYEITWDM
ncbi:MAG: TonB-dependent receptor [Pseudomonadota bacterium]